MEIEDRSHQSAHTWACALTPLHEHPTDYDKTSDGISRNLAVKRKEHLEAYIFPDECMQHP